MIGIADPHMFSLSVATVWSIIRFIWAGRAQDRGHAGVHRKSNLALRQPVQSSRRYCQRQSRNHQSFEQICLLDSPAARLATSSRYGTMKKNPIVVLRLASLALLAAVTVAGCAGILQTGNAADKEGEIVSTAAGTSRSEVGEAAERYRSGDLEGALDVIETLISREEVSREVHNLRGVVLQQMDDQQAAIVSFSAAIDLDPGYADGYNNRGLSSQAIDNVAQAEADFRRAIELDPEFGLAHYNLGTFLYSQHDYAQAIEHLEKATKLLPEDSDVWFQLGLANDRGAQPEDAIAAFSQAIEIDQGFDDRSFYLRGIIYAEQGSFQEAEVNFDQAIRKGLRNADTLFYRALMHYYQGDYHVALDDLLEALSYEPQSPEIHYYLGFVYAQLGNQDKARDHAQRALELDPPVDYLEEEE